MGYEIGSKRGVANHYGPRGTDGQYGGQDNSVGKIKEASWTFDYDKLPAYSASNLEMQIPANSTVLHAHIRVLTAAVSSGTADLFKINSDTSISSIPSPFLSDSIPMMITALFHP